MPQNSPKREQQIAIIKALGIIALIVFVGSLIILWTERAKAPNDSSKMRIVIEPNKPATNEQAATAPTQPPAPAPTPSIYDIPQKPNASAGTVLISPQKPPTDIPAVTQPEPEITEPEREAAATVEQVVVTQEPEVSPVPPPIPGMIQDISLTELSAQSSLWPETLKLTRTQQVEIRYNNNVYGYMEFDTDTEIEVESISPNGEVLGAVNNYFLSLSADQTDLFAWFASNHSDTYHLTNATTATPPSTEEDLASIDTKEGNADFWSEMRIWCYKNYGAASIMALEDNLVFKWQPKENVPINFQYEAREIARHYLLKRAERGSKENYASCEIRHPGTGELLGSAGIFIPRL